MEKLSFLNETRALSHSSSLKTIFTEAQLLGEENSSLVGDISDLLWT